MVKKRKKLRLSSILLIGLLLVPVCLFSNQLPAGKNDRTYAKWEWNDATLQSVAAHLSIVSGVDIIVDSRIASERVRLSLRNRTWQDVVRIICQIKGLKYSVIDNYVYIADERDINERLIRDVQTARNLEALEDLERFTIKLKNTTADEMLEPVRGVLSQRGRVTPVKHTNSLVIHELRKNIDEVRAFVEDMDREMLQISISAKIVEISSGFQSGMGIQWSFFDGRGSEISHLPTEARGQGILEQAFGRATYGVLDPNGFSIALEYLFTNTSSEIIAEPQITTLENREARIFMGSQIPLTYFDHAGNINVQMIDAGTELIVTPTVTGQGQIKMALNPVKKSHEMPPQGPIIHEQGAQTNVVVQDGETIVIAGLTSDDAQETESGVPFLKDIPIIGHFFKRHSQVSNRRDLVIFVTPHIIKRTRLDLEAEAAVDILPEPQFLDISSDVQ
jgi:type IV pilus assembly protein PilQ